MQYDFKVSCNFSVTDLDVLGRERKGQGRDRWAKCPT